MKTFHVSTARLCNLNCIYCSEGVRTKWVLHHDITLGRKTTIPPSEDVYRDIKIWSENYKSVVFSSWEPTLNPDLPEFIAFAKKMWFSRIELVTNGIKISDRNYFDKLLWNGLTNLVISVNSFHPEISKIISQNNYDGKKTFTSLKHAVASGCELVVNIVITNHTLITLNQTLAVLLKIWVKVVTLSFVRYNNFNMKWDGYDRITPNKVSYTELIRYFNKHNLEILCDRFDICNFNDVPVCVLKKMKISYASFQYSKPFIYIDDQQKVFEARNVGVTRLFPKTCKSCSVKQECCGVEKTYVRIYGKEYVQQELYPIKQES